jgi:hypothetical protein
MFLCAELSTLNLTCHIIADRGLVVLRSQAVCRLNVDGSYLTLTGTTAAPPPTLRRVRRTPLPYFFFFAIVIGSCSHASRFLLVTRQLEANLIVSRQKMNKQLINIELFLRRYLDEMLNHNEWISEVNADCQVCAGWKEHMPQFVRSGSKRKNGRSVSGDPRPDNTVAYQWSQNTRNTISMNSRVHSEGTSMTYISILKTITLKKMMDSLIYR